MAERVAVILLAAGSSSRMAGVDKVWADLGGEPLLARSLRTALAAPGVTEVVVVTRAARHGAVLALAPAGGAGGGPAVVCAEGGARRQDSVARGIAAAPEADWYLVHDAARPLASVRLYERVLEAARAWGAAVPAVRAVDTMKRVDADGRVLETLERGALRAVQTPQGFAGPLLRRAHQAVCSEATDDASMVEALGEPVVTVAGESANLKVTTTLDLVVARALAAEAAGPGGEGGG